uniref:Reverse transcriptase Ty1/copia-type domain-containing protein n=1 Tax=Tanacetum cinerariifolium TaxID=118510 RepID=A0A6L2J960_TANCI|nr:hypothetical protein [Tanacetum cinerariifolium]
MQLIQKLRDDQKCVKKVEPSSRSNAIEDIISIGSFVEALGLNHYVLCSTTKNGDEKLNEDIHSKTNKELVDQEDQAFFEELEKLKRQEKEANDAAKILRKTTPVNTASTPVKTTRLSRNVNAAGLSSPDLLTYANQDDYQIPSLEDIYAVPNDEIFTSASSDAEGFIDPKFLMKLYKVVKALYGLHQAPRAWYATLSTFLMKIGYIRGIINKTLFIKKDQKDIMLTASNPIETKKPLVKDAKATDLDVHLYRSMIGSLMYLTTSRPDIIYVVYACSRFQVTPKTSHLQVVKRIFRRLITWQCKKQTIVATSTTEAEYVAVGNCYGQVSWIQNQMLDYGFNFINIKIYIDNESTIWEDKNAKTRLNIEEGNFNKLDDLVGEGTDYAVNKRRSTGKIKVLNVEAEGVSAAGETLSTATLAVSTVSKELDSLKQTGFGKDFSNPLMVDSLPKNYMAINAPCHCNKALAILEQMATGKETSNPFMNVKDDKVSNEFKFIKEKIRE